MANCEIAKIDSNITGAAYAEEECLKQLPADQAAIAASGSLSFIDVGEIDDTVTIGGVVFVLTDDPVEDTDVEIGATPVETAANFAAVAAGAVPGVSVSNTGALVELEATVPGAAGNSIGLDTNSDAVTVSGLTLTGGADAGGTIWYGLEPNSYSDFGGELSTVARAPIDPSRQNKKGAVTDLDASGGFNSDFTQSNLTRLMQGFFFADARETFSTAPMNGPAVPVTAVAAGASTYAFAGADSLAVGDLVLAEGFGNPTNNGLKTVSAVAAGLLTVSQTLANETPSAGAKISKVGAQFPAADLSVEIVGGLTTLVTDAGDFTDFDELQPGVWIFVGGDASGSSFVNNRGFARIFSVSPICDRARRNRRPRFP